MPMFTSEYAKAFFLSNNSIGAKDWELSGNKLGVSGNKLRVMSLQIKFHESTNQVWVYNCEPTIRWSENPVSLLKGLQGSDAEKD